MGLYQTDEETIKPNTPNSGERLLYPKVDGWYDLDDNDIETKLTQPIFGRNIDLSVFENYTMTTSGTSWDTYAGLQIPIGKAGTYLVIANSIIRMSGASRDAWMRLSKNGTTVDLEMKEELKDPSSAQQVPRTLMKKVTLAEGDYLDLDFATEDTSVTLTIKEGSIILWRVA